MPFLELDAHRRAALAAAGCSPFDLVIQDVRLVNVLTKEIYPAHIGIKAGLIAAVFHSEESPPEALETFDGDGLFAVPGLIDSHLHIESSMVLPPAFAAAIVPRGVLTIIAEPHEIANVMGLAGIRLLIEAGRDLPLDCFWQAPSCVPALPLETSGADIGPDDVLEILTWPEIVALGEVMDFTAVIGQHGRTAEIVSGAVLQGAVIEGHAPNLTGRELAAYVAAGVDSDHTFVTPELALERLRNGVTLQLQLKSLAPETLQAAERTAHSLNLCLVTDDVLPDDLLANGHLDHVIRTAVARGLSPLEAIRAVTIAPARRMRLHDRGAIAPGKLAHLVLTASLEDFCAEAVFHRGRLVARKGRLICDLREYAVPLEAYATVRIPPPPRDAFVLRAPAVGPAVRVRVIGMHPTTTYTTAETAELPVREGEVAWQESDLCLAVVFERHGRGGTQGYGLLRNALSRGAVSTTWSHDSHNLLVVGRTPEDMVAAARWVVTQGGGMAAALNGDLIAAIRLPIGGILSDQPIDKVATDVSHFRQALKRLGFQHQSPFMALSAITLAVSPALKLTDKGLIDVERGEIVSLFLD